MNKKWSLTLWRRHWQMGLLKPSPWDMVETRGQIPMSAPTSSEEQAKKKVKTTGGSKQDQGNSTRDHVLEPIAPSDQLANRSVLKRTPLFGLSTQCPSPNPPQPQSDRLLESNPNQSMISSLFEAKHCHKQSQH